MLVAATIHLGGSRTDQGDPVQIRRNALDTSQRPSEWIAGPVYPGGRSLPVAQRVLDRPLTDTGYPSLSAAAKRSTIAAAGSTSVIAPTLWPAYIAIASTSPAMPASGILAA
jgi:hypothetical protein